MTWLEVPIVDVSRAGAFYGAVLGWECPNPSPSGALPAPLPAIGSVHLFTRGRLHGCFCVVTDADLAPAARLGRCEPGPHARAAVVPRCQHRGRRRVCCAARRPCRRVSSTYTPKSRRSESNSRRKQAHDGNRRRQRLLCSPGRQRGAICSAFRPPAKRFVWAGKGTQAAPSQRPLILE